MEKPSIFAVTENGESRYCETTDYGGLSGIAMRFYQNSQDENGKVRPFFDRLDSVVEISEDRWKEIDGNPGDADVYYSYIIINVDTNMIHADEDWPQERRYTEIPVDKLIKTVASLIDKHSFAGNTGLDKLMLYNTIKRKFYKKRDVCFPYIDDSKNKKPSVLEQIRAGLPPQDDRVLSKNGPVAVDRD